LHDEIRLLIGALDHDDPGERRRAGTALLAQGTAAVPALIGALNMGSPQARRSAAFLLGSYKRSADAMAALAHAVIADPEPKVRKNAAIAFGTIGNPQGVPALVTALEQETIAWVRPSLILALGAIGGESAHAALRKLAPVDDAEREALRKALDRTTTIRQPIEWNAAGAERLQLLLEAPIGLEFVAHGEAMQRGIGPCTHEGPGLLRCPPGTQPAALLPALRCIYHLLVDAGSAGSIQFENPEQSATHVAALIEQSAELRTIREWLVAGTEPIRYRFSVEQHVRRETLRAILEAVRATCLPLGLSDSPSRYDIELFVRTDASGSRLLIRPSFMPDSRFDYRQKDVGASINPVVAASLVRLLRTSAEATVFDPTCGSGTLLIERAILDRTTRLFGVDISRTAVAAARTNTQAAALGRRVQIRQGDATDPGSYRDCDEAIANLPFGQRTGRGDTDLAHLYRSILDNLGRCVRSGGHALLYTTKKQALKDVLAHHRAAFQVERELRIFSGGLWAHLWILRHV
jgi:predicted RNA methylase